MKVHLITVRWVGTQMNPDMMDGVMTGIGDWIRFNGFTWLVHTNRLPTDIRMTVMSALQPNDSCLVLEIARAPAEGWAEKWVWDWIHPKLM